MTTETSQTLDRGLSVLRIISDAPAGLSVTELSTRTGVNRTVVYRLLATLEQHGMIRRDLAGRVHLGLGVLQIARRVHPLLRDAAVPVLRSLADDLGATALLAVVDGTDTLAVAVAEPTWTDYHVAYRLGTRRPLDASAPGLAVLAARDQHRVVPRKGGDGADGATGSLVRCGAEHEGTWGVAAPIIGLPGIEGSVGVVTLEENTSARVHPRVLSAATELAESLR